MGLFGKKPSRLERAHPELKAPKPPPGPSAGQLNAETQAGGVTVYGCGCSGQIWNGNAFPVIVQVFRIIVKNGKQIGSLPTNFFQIQPDEVKPIMFVSPNDRFFIWNEANGVCARIKPVPNGMPKQEGGQPAAAT